MRGICVTDRTFARNETSFALLMRSVDDAQVIESPPWWNPRHAVELFITLLALSFGVQMIYISVKRSQARAITEERERLALEMHDTLAQSYAGLGFQLEALCSETVPGSRMCMRLESIVSMVRAGHLEARRNIAALRPSNLEQMGLPKALEDSAHTIVQGGSIAISVSVRGEPKQLPLRIGDTFYRIGQEAIANAVRHGHPRTIEIRLVYGRPTLRLTVRDDGQGFSIEDEASGFGIRGMLRRAESINASLRIHSSQGQGTSVHVRVIPPQSSLTSWWQQAVCSTGWKRGQHGKSI
jgi:signal transduction histidine kinase